MREVMDLRDFFASCSKKDPDELYLKNNFKKSAKIGELVTFQARVLYFKYKNADTGYKIFETSVGKKEKCTVVGNVDIEEGLDYLFNGKWVHHQLYGLQVEATSSKLIEPTDTDGIRRYLESGLFTQIGPIRALRMVKKFGTSLFDILDNHPERLTEISGITEERMELIKEEWVDHRKKAEIYSKFYELGFSSTHLSRMEIVHGVAEKTLEYVKLDPYKLIWEVGGFKFEELDVIAKKIGVLRDYRRTRAAIMSALKSASSLGHTYIAESSMDPIVKKYDVTYPEIWEAGKQCGDALVRIDHELSMIWSLRSLYESERTIAASISELLGRSGREEPDIPDKYNLTELQREAVTASQTHKFMVITGPPGTGKTYTLKAIIDMCSEDTHLASPTGKAAKRMKEATEKDARTIHRLLGWRPEGFEFNALNPLPSGKIIIDESSMLDVELAADLFRAIEARRHSVVFIGDVDQLPAVGPGAVLKDIINSQQVPVVRFKEIMRQAAGSLIITNSHRINNGNPIDPGGPAEDFEFIQMPMTFESCVPLILQQVERLNKEGYDFFRDIQVLAPMKKGEYGVFNLNKQIRDMINPPVDKAEIAIGEERFRVGDRVIQTRNNYEIGIMNGEVGFIQNIDEKEKLTVIDFGGTEPVVMERKHMMDIQLAFALTIHKSQGSEFPAVIVVMHDSQSFMLRRQLLYTAVSRARKRCVIVSTGTAVARAILNDYEDKRNTLLKSLL